ncbi:hypothetical protein MWU78_21400 [Arenibacter sp. F26102]|uniref:hypothetical protein n=1 Tax=Arenibacter sp. F26102 TaxID=2926416 RepID=UPI001FF51654|nr:hypothetical protein [Arenibacter sp. F26102]MCK0148217.1 hypothetical protein [Arenibacter sp. F26102]
MRSTIMLKLDMVITLNDITRMKSGQRPIKNIHRLALLIDTRYGDEYAYERIKDVMYKAQKTGYQQHEKLEWMEGLINKICAVLDTTRDELVKEVEQ